MLFFSSSTANKRVEEKNLFFGYINIIFIVHLHIYLYFLCSLSLIIEKFVCRRMSSLSFRTTRNGLPLFFFVCFYMDIVHDGWHSILQSRRSTSRRFYRSFVMDWLIWVPSPWTPQNLQKSNKYAAHSSQTYECLSLFVLSSCESIHVVSC